LLNRRHESRRAASLAPWLRRASPLPPPEGGRADAADHGGDRVLNSEARWPRQLLPVAALSALLTFIAAGSAVLALSDTVRTGHELGQLSRAQRFHQDADMMHDALNANVAQAQSARRVGSAARRAEVLRDTETNVALMRKDLNQLARVDVPQGVQREVQALHAPRLAYAALADQVVRSELAGQPDPVARQRFTRQFEDLTLRQRNLTNTLADAAEDVEEEQDRHELVIASVLVVALAVVVVGWAVLVGTLLRTGSRLIQALRREAEQRAMADQLQVTLLPDHLPDIPGLRLAARTKPVNSAMRVGGDWYDVISLPSGDVGLVVGDVVGHDLRAAAAMGQLRAALRAFAVYEPSPAAVLTRVNRVADLLQVTDLTTCLYAVVHPATRTVRWASAGHLNPLVVRPDGQAQLLPGDPGPPIGVADDAVYDDRICDLEPGGSLLIYTDGLVERRRTPISDNLARLEGIRALHADPEELCDHVLEIMLADEPELRDDMTMLVLQAL
jgi:serine phosphatase RsbU (regulator of sigma subunit)